MCQQNEIEQNYFKIKSGYYLELLTPERVKLLGSTKNEIKIKMEKMFLIQK